METMVITLCHCFYKAEKKKKRNILCGLKKLVIQLAEANWKMYRALERRDEHQNTKMNQGKTGPFIIFLQIIKKNKLITFNNMNYQSHHFKMHQN